MSGDEGVASTWQSEPPLFVGLPTSGLAVLLGAPASGKTTFSKLAFSHRDVIGSDTIRSLVGGSAYNLDAADDAMALLVDLVERRLRQGRFTVVDSTGTHEDLIERLQTAADRLATPVRYLWCPTPVDECLRRNRSRVDGRVPDAVIERIAAAASGIASELAAAGRSVEPVQRFVAADLTGRSVFLAMPVTEFISSESGFRADKRKLFELVHAALGLTGVTVASAAVNEDYGAINLEPKVYTRYDIDEILAADCLLVGTTSNMSPDIYLEAGVAIGAGMPVGMVLPQRGGMTGMMRGLIELGIIRRVEFLRDADLPAAVASLAVQLLTA
jgi:protein phosphatase